MAFAFWGAGIYGGMQGCPHDVSSSIDMSHYTDWNDDLKEEYRENAEEIRETRAKIRETERTIRQKERRVEQYFRRHCKRPDRAQIELELDKIEDVPVENDCSGTPTRDEGLNSCMCSRRQGDNYGISIRAGESCQNFVRCVKYNYIKWGESAPSVCDKNNFGAFFNCGSGESDTAYTNCERPPSCQETRRRVQNLLKHQQELTAFESELETLNERRTEIREEQRNLRDEAKDDYREQVRDIAEFGGTESGFCLDCTKQREFSWSRDGLGAGLNLLMGALGGYLGYKGFKDTVRKNVALGYPTPPYSAAQVMFPYVASGIYGAVSSALGGGSLACGSSINGSGGLSMLGTLGLGSMLSGGTTGSGAFGYPSGLFGSSGAAAALQLSLGAGLPPGAASLFGSGLPGASLFGSGLPGGAASLLLGSGLPGSSLSALLGSGAPGASLFGSGLPGANLSALLGSGLPGANIFGSGALSLLGAGNQFNLFGAAGAGDFSASSTAYTEYYQQQMEYMQRQMAMRQRYMEAQMERRASIQGLAQEIYKIQEQIQVIANSPIEYGVSVSGSVELSGSASAGSSRSTTTQTPSSGSGSR